MVRLHYSIMPNGLTVSAWEAPAAGRSSERRKSGRSVGRRL